jgi:tetratricopeptide (TPR) repeat protein
MGREHARKRKYLLLYLACLTTTLWGILGCTHLPEKWRGKAHLARARAHMAEGDYDASLRVNKEVLKLFPNTLGDQALFQMGQVYAHPENPNRDYQLSLEIFQRVVNEFPESFLRENARIWILFIEGIRDKNQELDTLNGRLDTLNRRIDLLRTTVIKKENQINVLQSQLVELERQMETLKKIDLGIEEKKRKTMP